MPSLSPGLSSQSPLGTLSFKSARFRGTTVEDLTFCPIPHEPARPIQTHASPLNAHAPTPKPRVLSEPVRPQRGPITNGLVICPPPNARVHPNPHGAASDTDGDGLSLMAEFSGGTSPLFGDRSDPGGVSWAQSGFVIVDANDAPTAVPLSLTRLSGTPMRISLASILSAGASDPDGHALTVSSVGPSQQGANVRISGSSILYSPLNDQDDSFPYTVRDPGGLTATSTVNVRVVGLAGKIGSFTLNASGQPVMQFAGIPGYRYAIERSPDLTNWETIHTLTAPSAGVFQFNDPAAPGGSMYYRLRYVP